MKFKDNNNRVTSREILIIGLIISGLIPLILHLAKAINPSHSYVNLLLAIGMVWVTISIAVLNHNIKIQIDDLKSSIDSIRELELLELREDLNDIAYAFPNLNSVKVYTLSRKDLYIKLGQRVKKAKQRVWLTYLAKKPPTASSYSNYDTKITYLKFLNESIIDNNKAFKRIILLTEENKSWIKDIVRTGKDKNRFSLAILIDRDNIPRVPFQILDDVNLVLLGKVPAESVVKRDVIIESKDVIQTYEVYFDRLWKSNNCIQIVENGIVNTENYDQYLN